MNFNRNITSFFTWIFDEILPPFLRDSKIFMFLFFYILFGKKAKYFLEFKQKAPFLSKEEIENYYSLLADVHINRPTDLNRESIVEIMNSIEGKSVLDIGCGRGYLATKISRELNINVTAIDIHINSELKNNTNPKFLKANIESLPFENNLFDTVICTHTLEHVQDFQKALSEIRRVAGQKIIIVVPRQREYKYTFDLHLNFYPYINSFQLLMKNEKAICRIIKNDIFYCEDVLG